MSPENAKVFQADDDQGWYVTLKRPLEKSGHLIIISVRSRQEALDKIGLAKEQGVTVAILDNRMPREGDGQEVANALKEAIPNIKIISLCVSTGKPKWADYHFDKGKFSYEVAFEKLLDLITNI